MSSCWLAKLHEPHPKATQIPNGATIFNPVNVDDETGRPGMAQHVMTMMLVGPPLMNSSFKRSTVLILFDNILQADALGVF